ncbi:OmpL47-type beta-barrel domain-containing protein [Methanocella sp. MCL-LM]|uniref:OmpL47-type beta-barrel domain-containing protein n=1 Tax=Methanocella sp. MCL-LM TaxID=3412035 RepID=UPI003C79418D
MSGIRIVTIAIVALSILLVIVTQAQVAGPSITCSPSPDAMKSGSVTTISYTMANVVDSDVGVVINGSGGDTVWTTQLSGQAAGTHSVTWDGTDGHGNPVPDDRYTITLTATNGTIAGLPSAFGIAVDGNGDIYIADALNHRVLIFDSTGALIQTIGGTRGTGNYEFNSPWDLEVDGNGNIYVADTDNNRIQVYDSTGAWLRTIEGGSVQFNAPASIEVDTAGNTYVADSGNNRIQIFDSTGTWQEDIRRFGAFDERFENPRGVAVDGAGNIYVADTSNCRIHKYDSTGTWLQTFGSPGEGNGEFYNPWGIVVDSAGNIYVADTDNGRIQVFDNAGTWQHNIEGSATGPFRFTFGVALDADENIYITDFDNDPEHDSDRVCVFYSGVEGVTTVCVDNIVPVVTCTLPDTSVNGWYTTDVPVALSATDVGGSGVDQIEYSLDNAHWNTYTGPFEVTGEGTNTVHWNCSDNAGNYATGSRQINIDKPAPASSGNPPPTISMDEMYGRQPTTTAAPTQLPTATSGPTATVTETMVTATITPSPTLTPTPMSTPTPAATPEEPTSIQGHCLWPILLVLAVIVLMAGGYYWIKRQ